MKFRIIASIVLVAICIAVYFLTNGSSTPETTPEQTNSGYSLD